ncbi:helix-turn-helix domain-containing protein [Streptomyces sp. NRRL B-24720]|uniref:helix-turn-helix domain-containing protein n=1 Tax=Streptomyces sp. NRRL B-24720 TaxID=1476876 RepID=UPI0005674C08|nr:helix-turn-helix domain-containing protein [Streptomyces sp. NRRL B-24720]
MGAFEPITPEDLETIRRFHADGCGRNEIARRTGRSPRTISIYAAKLGLSFDRTATEEATRARMADLAEKRTILAEALTDDALRLSAQVWEPTVVFNFGGKDNDYNERSVDEPPAADKRQLMSAATNAAAQSLRLVPPSADSGSDDARSMLGKLFSGLGEVLREQQAGDEEAEGESP